MYAKALIIGSVVALLANPVFAEPGSCDQTAQSQSRQRIDPPSVQKRVAHLAIDLELDASQQAQVTQLLETHEAKRKEIHQKYQQQAMHEELKTLRADLKESMAQVLSAEQLNAFEQLSPPKPRPQPPTQRDIEPNS